MVRYSLMVNKIFSDFVSIEGQSLIKTCVVYERKCSYYKTYIGETIRISESSWKDQENAKGKVEPTKHFQDDPLINLLGNLFSAPSDFC